MAPQQPPLGRDRKAFAELHALHRLDAHERLRDQAVDLAVPVHVRPETRRHPVAEHLDHTTERVARGGRALDLRDHRFLGRRIEAAQRGLVDAIEVGGSRTGNVGGDRGRTHPDHVRDHRGPEVREQRLRERAGRDARRGLTRRGALEHVAGVVEAVLLHADEIGVAGPRLAELLLGHPGSGRHLFLPLRPLGVVDHDRDRRAERGAVPDPAEQLDVVPLELHPRPPTKAEPTAGQLGADLLHGHGNARGQAFDHDHERGAVRLPCSQVAQHRDARLPVEAEQSGPKPATG